ncbi:MAG: alpha/beta fold hydrolase [Burkholderiaceae bacterium]
MTTAGVPVRAWQRLVAAVLAASALLLAGCAALDEQQRRWIFQPNKSTWAGAAAAADGMAERWIDFAAPSSGERIRLHALWLPQDRADAPVLLYLHGARWDVRSSAFRMRRMHELGFAVLGMDYRGFGQSTDQLPSEESAYEDARAAWNWLRREMPRAPRYIFGHSLGAAIAVHLAAEVDDERGVMLEGSFPSIPDVVSTMRFGWLPLGPLITQRFEAAQLIARIGSPVLVVHGSNDALIRPELGRALYERARAPKRFVLVDGGTHHNTNALGQDQYREAVRSLFGLRI